MLFKLDETPIIEFLKLYDLSAEAYQRNIEFYSCYGYISIYPEVRLLAFIKSMGKERDDMFIDIPIIYLDNDIYNTLHLIKTASFLELPGMRHTELLGEEEHLLTCLVEEHCTQVLDLSFLKPYLTDSNANNRNFVKNMLKS
jgi:hypothetical protein